MKTVETHAQERRGEKKIGEERRGEERRGEERRGEERRGVERRREERRGDMIDESSALITEGKNDLGFFAENCIFSVEGRAERGSVRSHMIDTANWTQ